jgi:hypothetical protein
MNTKFRCLHMVLGLTILMAAQNIHGATPVQVSLERTLGSLVGSPTLSRPEDLAKALHIAISKPMLTSSHMPQGDAVGLTYQIGSNPWGLTQMDLQIQANEDDTHETNGVLGLQLDKTYCLKPSNFPASVGLQLRKIPVPNFDGPGTYELVFYNSPFTHGTTLRIEASSENDCAKTASLTKVYDRDGVGPPMAALIPSDLANPLPAHPPYSANEFWQKLMALIRLHDGYVDPNELERSLGVKFRPITIGYKSTARRELRARIDSYFSVFYEVTGPGYQSVQLGVVPDGQGSALAVEIPSFTFLGKSGEAECLASSTAESDLVHAGWTAVASRHGPFNPLELKTLTLAGRDSNIQVNAERRGDHYCVTAIRVAGALQ